MCIAGSLSHTYVAGRLTGDGGTEFGLIQYKLAVASPQYRSIATFPVYYSPTYEATCMGSISLGGVDATYGFQYTQAIVAGTLALDSGQKVSAVASFETKPTTAGGSGIGDLRLMWSTVEDSIATDVDETPLKVTTNGEFVGVLSKLTSSGSPVGLSVRVFQYGDGKEILSKTYSGSDIIPVGLFVAENFVVVGGSAPNSSTGQQELMILAYAINDDAGYSIAAGDLFGPAYTSSGTSRTFKATCMCSSENHQVNQNGSNYFAIAGRSSADSSPSDGDWFVSAWQFSVHPTTHAPVYTNKWNDTGKSLSTYEDSPVAMCLGVTPVNYQLEEMDPLPAYCRLWVTGNRHLLSGGKSELTTVQYDVEGSGGIEWFNHHLVSGKDVVAASIGAMDFASGRETRAYVGGYAESATSGNANDFLLIKYSSEPTTSPLHANRNPIWSHTHAASGNQQAASIMPTHPVSTNYSPGRLLLITGLTGNPTDMFTQRYVDSND